MRSIFGLPVSGDCLAHFGVYACFDIRGLPGEIEFHGSIDSVTFLCNGTGGECYLDRPPQTCCVVRAHMFGRCCIRIPLNPHPIVPKSS